MARKMWSNNWKRTDTVRGGSPAEVVDALNGVGECSSLFDNDYAAWEKERGNWAKELLGKGVLQLNSTSVQTFRGYKYQITIGQRGGMKFKALGKVR